MLDLSDGLLRDGGRIARASGVVLELDPEALASEVAGVSGAVGEEAAWDCVLAGGEEHSLLATFPGDVPDGWRVIGSVRAPRADEAPGVHIEGRRPRHTGWDHFTNGEGRRP
jgi:Thiamine monophosphate kinase